MNNILFMYFSKMTRNSSRRLISLIAVGFSIAFLAVFCSGFGRHLNFFVDHQQNFALSHLHRKLLELEMEPNRAFADKCSTSDIVVSQGPTLPLPNGIPTYTVEIMNVCASGCNISGIHLSCGWFSSARLINPTVFKRIAYDDCLVNGGNALANGDALSFQYANSFSYPLSVSSVRC